MNMRLRNVEKQLEEIEILSKGATQFIEDKFERTKGQWSQAWLFFPFVTFLFGMPTLLLIHRLLQPKPDYFGDETIVSSLMDIIPLCGSVFVVAMLIYNFVWVYRKFGFSRAAYEQKLRAEIEAEAALFLERRKQAELRGEIKS